MFGPVWTVLYVLIAVAGWRIWERDRSGPADEAMVGADGGQFPLDAGVFAAHQLGLALIVIVLMLAAIVAFMAASRRKDHVAAALFAPYAGWVTFATVSSSGC